MIMNKCGSERLAWSATFLYTDPSPSSDSSLQARAQFTVFKTSRSSALENTYGAAAFIQLKAVQCRDYSCPEGVSCLTGPM